MKLSGGLFFSIVFYVTGSVLMLASLDADAQLILSPNNATALASQLAGPGLSVFNVVYNGPPSAISGFNGSGTNLGIGSGILLATGDVNIARGPNNVDNAGMTMAWYGDPDLDSLAGTFTFDAAILEFDFIPQNDTVSFRYVFASEEYPEYVCSNFNDVFAFFITGPGITGKKNMAIIPGTTSAVAINTVNPGVVGFWGTPGPACVLGYSGYYVNNVGGLTLQYDGFTTVMTAKSDVIPCQTYHLRLAIADAGDGGWDSGVFLEEGSLTTTPVADAGPDVIICSGQTAGLGVDSIVGWHYSWTPTTGLNNPGIYNPTLTLTNNSTSPTSFTYVVTATKGSCVITDSVDVTVNPIPVATFSLPATACDAQPVAVSYSGITAPGMTYNWNFGGGSIISGSGAGPYSISYPGPGTYTVSLSLDLGGCVSPIVTSQVTIEAPPVAAFAIPATGCPGDTLTINFTGQNTSTSVQNWNFGGASVISGSGSGPYQLTFGSSGSFTVSLVMNGGACPSSQYSQTVTLNNLSINAGPDASICTGSQVSIGGSSSPGYSYSWTPSTGLSNANISNPSVTLSNGGLSPVTSQFYLMASSGNCRGYDTVDVTVLAEPIAMFAVPAAACINDVITVDFTGQSPASTNYNWNFGGGNVVSGSGLGPYQLSFGATGTYSIRLDMSVTGCPPVVFTQNVTVGNSPASAGADISFCSGTIVNIGASPIAGVVYTWSPTTGLSNPNISNPVVTTINSGSVPVTTQYILTAVNGSCSGSDTINVTTYPQPTAAFTLPGASCLNDTLNVVFTGTSPAGTVCNWNFGSANVVSGSGLGPYQLSFDSIGTYNITLDMGMGGCPSSQAVRTIFVGNSPASAGPDISYCSGTQISIGSPGSSGITYSWSPATGLSDPNIANPVVTLTNSGSNPLTTQFIVSATTGNCAGSDTVDVVINPQPNASIVQLPDTICSGGQAQVVYAGTAGSNAVFNWNFSNGTVLSGSGSGPYTIAFNSTGNSAISLSVDEFGCVSSANENIYIENMPAAAFILPPAACLNDTVMVSFAGQSNPSTVFNWNFGGANIISGTGAGPYALTWSGSGIFPVTLSLSNGICQSQDAKNISVGSQVANAGTDVVFCSGDTMSIGTTGATGFAYSWSPSTGLINAAIADPAVTLVNAGTSPLTYSYILTATNFSCFASDTVEVTVNPFPLPSFTAVDSVCAGDDVQVDFNGSAGIAATYNWNFGAGIIITDNGAGSFVVRFDSSGANMITLDVDDRGCVSSYGRQIFARDNPLPAFSIPPQACIGDTVQVDFTGSANPGSLFNWQFGNAIVVSGSNVGPFTIYFPSPGVQTIGLTVDQSGCLGNVIDSIELSAPVTANFTSPANGCAGEIMNVTYNGSGGNATYSWDFGTATVYSGSGSGPYEIGFQNAGTYVVRLDILPGVCPGDSTTGTIVIHQPDADAGYDSVLCAGSSVTIGTSALGGHQYSWSPSADLANPNSSPTIFTPSASSQSIIVNHFMLTVTDPFGCIDTDAVDVTILPRPEVHFTEPPPQCLAGNSFGFAPSNMFLSGTQFHWTFGANASIDSSGDAYPQAVSYAVPGTSNVTLYAVYNGCDGPVETHPVTVYEMPVPDFIPDVYEGCQPLSVHFTNLSSSNAVNFSWLIEGNDILDSSVDWTFNNAGTYEVDLTAINNAGCASVVKKPYLINVYALPVANFVASPDYLVFPDATVDFSNLSQGAEYTTWDFGDGTLESFYDGKHVYADTGSYRIILYVATNHGCKDTVDGTIRIDGGFSLFIPDAFTPNGDGVNDSFQGYGSFLSSYRMWIYDRWGIAIYYTEDYDKPWDGRMQSAVQSDTYVYRILANDLNGKEHTFVGKVTLVR